MASGFSSQAITSGAIQYGVPMKVFRLPTVLSSWALTPKSTGYQKRKIKKQHKSFNRLQSKSYLTSHRRKWKCCFFMGCSLHKLFVDKHNCVLFHLKMWEFMECQESFIHLLYQRALESEVTVAHLLERCTKTKIQLLPFPFVYRLQCRSVLTSHVISGYWHVYQWIWGSSWCS